jgi:hypothetical protein
MIIGCQQDLTKGKLTEGRRERAKADYAYHLRVTRS